MTSIRKCLSILDNRQNFQPRLPGLATSVCESRRANPVTSRDLGNLHNGRTAACRLLTVGRGSPVPTERPPSMQHALCVALATVLCTTAACGSQYTILDRSTIEVSPNARLSAQNLVADASKYPTVIQQLALAQEVYQR